MSTQPSLWVVLPVYNEATAIRDVVKEWVFALRKTGASFGLTVINDGSTDETGLILDEMEFEELQVLHRSNVGHGPSCRFGYQTAVEQGAEWVLQLDSDGQCDPAFFPQLWEARATGPVVFGCRVTRDDGLSRWLISRVVSLVVFLHNGHWIKDANVPYRLIRSDYLKKTLDFLPEHAFFTNILLSCLLATEICWKPIRFRRRSGGCSTIKLRALCRFAGRLSKELRELKQMMSYGEKDPKSI